MPQEKISIVPVSLHPSANTAPAALPASSGQSCVIKKGSLEITFHGGVDERTLQMILREIKYR